MPNYQFQRSGIEQAAPAFPLRTKSSAGAPGKQSIIMVGMHLTKTRGGISTLTDGILNSSLAEEFQITYIASQSEDYGLTRKLILALSSAVRFTFICIFDRPAVAYVHIGSNASLYRESAFVVLAKLFQIKALSHFHAGDIAEYLPNQPAMGRRFIRWAMGLSDSIIAVSEESSRQLGTMLPSKTITLIPNVIDISNLFFDRSSDVLSSNGTPVRLLFVGAVGKLKGERDLVAAIKLMIKTGLKIKVSFLGHGAETMSSYCMQMSIAESIGHLGPVSMKHRIKHFEAADIFVLPTYAEAMPISIIEAMAAGLPIVSTNVGGIPELITDGQEGLLIQPGDVPSLAEKISSLALDSQARITMGKKAQNKILEKMDFESYIERLQTTLKQLAASHQ